MLFCDSCDRGWHRQHLNPPLLTIPRGKWNCPTCQKQSNFFETLSELELGKKRNRKQARPLGLLSTPSTTTEAGGRSSSSSNRKSTITAGGNGYGGEYLDGEGTEEDDFDENSLLLGGTHNKKGKNKEGGGTQLLGIEGGGNLLANSSSSYQEHPIVKVPNQPQGSLLLNQFHPLPPAYFTPLNPTASSSSSFPQIPLSSAQSQSQSTPKSRPLKRQRSSNTRGDNNPSTPFPDQPWLQPRPPPSPTPSDTDQQQQNQSGSGLENEDPYGGLLNSEESKTDGRVPQEKDRKRFKMAKELVDRRELGLMKKLEKDEIERKREERRKNLEEKQQQAVVNNVNNLVSSTISEGTGGGGESNAPSPNNESGNEQQQQQQPVPPSRELRTHRPVSSNLLESLSASASGSNSSQLVNTVNSTVLPSSSSSGPTALLSSNNNNNPLDESLPTLPPNYTGLPIRPITHLIFPPYEIKTWYQAPFPEEYTRTPDGKLWVCELCLKYFRGRFESDRHRMKCKVRHPPGDEIYRDGMVSVFEVDGRKNKVYLSFLSLSLRVCAAFSSSHKANISLSLNDFFL